MIKGGLEGFVFLAEQIPQLSGQIPLPRRIAGDPLPQSGINFIKFTTLCVGGKNPVFEKASLDKGRFGGICLANWGVDLPQEGNKKKTR